MKFKILLVFFLLFIVKSTKAQYGVDSFFGIAGIKKHVMPITYQGGSFYPIGLIKDNQNRIYTFEKGIVNGNPKIAISRWLSSNKLDTTFGTLGWVSISFNNSISNNFQIPLLTADYKYVFAGFSINTGSGRDLCLSSFLPDGSIDSTFGFGGVAQLPSTIGDDNPTDIKLQNDGKIILTSTETVNYDFVTMRLLQNGNPDSSFNGIGVSRINLYGADFAHKIAIQNDGKILVAGEATTGGVKPALIRYLPNGNLDISFGTFGKWAQPISPTFNTLVDLAVMKDGNIIGLLVGSTITNNSVLIKWNNAGSLFLGFGAIGTKILDHGLSTSMLVDTIGNSYILAGNIIRKYKLDGTRDSLFGSYLNQYDFNIHTQGNASFLIERQSGNFIILGKKTNGANIDLVLSGIDTLGQIVPGFGLGGIISTPISFNTLNSVFTVNASLCLSDGSLLLAGNALVNSVNYGVVSKYLANGYLDSSFANQGKFIYPASGAVFCDLVQCADQSIILGLKIDYQTTKYFYQVIKLSQTGIRIFGFGNNGVVADSGLFIEPAANHLFKISLYNSNYFLVGLRGIKRFNLNGVLDTNFVSTPMIIRTLLVERNGKIVVANDSCLVRFLATGVFDPTFAIGGYYTRYVLTGCSPGYKAYFKTNKIQYENGGFRLLLSGGYIDQICFGAVVARDKWIRINEEGIEDLLPLPAFGIVSGYGMDQISLPMPDQSFLAASKRHVSNSTLGTHFSFVSKVKSNGLIDSTFGQNGTIYGEKGVFNFSSVSQTMGHSLASSPNNGIWYIRTFLDSIYLSKLKVALEYNLDFTSNKQFVGFGDSIHLTSSPNIIPLRYQWIMSTNNFRYLNGTDSSSANPIIQFFRSGVYSITLKAFYQDTIIQVSKINLISLSAEVSISANKNQLLAPDSVILNPIYNGNPTAFQWQIGPKDFVYLNQTDSISHNPKVYFPLFGNHSIQLKLTYADTVIVIDRPNYITGNWFWSLNFYSNLNNIGFGDTVRLYPQTNGVISTYRWLFPSGSVKYLCNTDSNSAQPIVQLKRVLNYDITLFAKFGDSSISVTKIGLITLMPQIIFNCDKNPIFKPDTVQFNSQVNGTPNSFKWRILPNINTFTNGTDSSSKNPRIYFPIYGNFTVELSVNYPDTVLVRRQENYISSNWFWTFSTSSDKNTVGFGDTVHLYAAATGPVSSYQWHFPAGSVVFVAGTNLNSQNPVIRIKKVGSIIPQVQVNYPDTFKLLTLSSIQLISQIDFSANKTILTGPDTIVLNPILTGKFNSIKWQIGPKQTQFINGTDSLSLNPVVYIPVFGKYHIQLTIIYPDTELIISKSNYIQSNWIWNLDIVTNKTIIMQGDTLILHASSNGNILNYQWHLPLDKISYLNGTDSTSAFPIFKILSTGYFNVGLTAEYSDTSLFVSRSNLIHVYPELNFTASKTAIGFGDTVYFQPITNGINPNYTWNFPAGMVRYVNGTNQNSSSPALQFIHSGNFRVGLTANFLDTALYVEKLNFINLSINVDFTANKTIIGFGDTVYFQPNSNGGNSNYNWSFPNGSVRYLNGTNKNSSIPIVQFIHSGVFSIGLTINYSDTSFFVEKLNYINLSVIADFFASKTSLTHSDTVTLTPVSNGHPLNYHWSIGTGPYTYVAPFDSNSIITQIYIQQSGIYSVALRINYLDTSILLVKNDLIHSTITGLKINSNPLYNVFPNPSNDKVYIETIQFKAAVFWNLYDAQGKWVKGSSIDSKTRYEIQLPEASGIYLLHIVDENNTRLIYKIIKE